MDLVTQQPLVTTFLRGQVPLREIHRLLNEKPVSLGLAVPDMLSGSPSIDRLASQGRSEAFNVLLVKADGTSAIFPSYGLVNGI
jgi:hypothetical protein